MKSLLQRFRRTKTKLRSARPNLQNQLPDATPDELETIEQVAPFTMTSPERLLALCRAIDYLHQQNIQGDIVECGVWRGGSMMAVAKTLAGHSDFRRQLWLYDTFEGMSPPTPEDVDFLGNAANRLLDEQDPDDASSIWCYSHLEEVQQNMGRCRYDEQKILFVKGTVEQTIPGRIPQRIALLRLDTDWYESTRHEMEHLFPRLVPGGVLIVDDYGHWKGCRRAIDEYLQQNAITMLLSRIDYTGRIGVFWPTEKRAA